jgi:hypothetical protein
MVGLTLHLSEHLTIRSYIVGGHRCVTAFDGTTASVVLNEVLTEQRLRRAQRCGEAATW